MRSHAANQLNNYFRLDLETFSTKVVNIVGKCAKFGRNAQESFRHGFLLKVFWIF